MSLPITHIYLARKIEAFKSINDNSDYVIGNIYPDIRYTKCIDRDKSHQVDRKKLINISKVKSNFEKGLYLHSIIDKIRISKAVEHKIITLNNGRVTPGEYLKDSIIKISEEIYFINQITEVQKSQISKLIVKNSKKEIEYTLKNKLENVSEEEAINSITLWNSSISQYILNFPSTAGIRNLLQLLNLNDSTFINLYRNADSFLKNEIVVNFLNDLKNNIDKYFNEFLINNNVFIDEPKSTIDKNALELVKESKIY